MNTYGTRSTTIVKGEGPYLVDADGRRYLDAISGIAVCGLGYSHPAVTEALCKQAQTLIHCSNLYNIEPQRQLGEALINASGMDRVFFSNSGAEANEAAIKIARKYAQSQGISEPEIIVADRSFHGRTMATLSATGNAKVQEGFAPLVSGFKHVAYDDVAAVANAASANTVAVMVEPVQGEGGVRVPANDYLNKLRELCDQQGWLLILDEIQTGNARCGAYFAYQLNDVAPDVVTTAKGLGNGVPIGACLARGKAAEVLQPGNHGSTFGGNPLATATALAVVNELNQEATYKQVAHLNKLLMTGFQEQLSNVAGVLDIRGKGLMIGIELDCDCSQLVEKAKQAGYLINVTSGNVVRLLPPFIMSDDEALHLVGAVVRLVHEALNTGA